MCLNASDNPRIQSVAPFGSTLLEVDVIGMDSGIGDAALALATNIVRLDCSLNDQITTVAPFSASLRHLVAVNESSLVGESYLGTAANLVTLDCSGNPKITSLAFCATSLQELTAEGEDCGMRGDEIATMGPQLWKVKKEDNDRITVQHLEGFTAVDLDGTLFVRRRVASSPQSLELSRPK